MPAKPSKNLLDDFIGYLDNSSGKITLVFTFLTLIISFITQILNNPKITRVSVLVLVIIVGGIIWFFSLHIYKKKEDFSIELFGYSETYSKHKYPDNFRWIALTVTILLPILLAFFMGLMTTNFTNQTVIVISKIGDDNCAEQSITQRIESELRLVKQQRAFIRLFLSETNISGEDKSYKQLADQDAFIIIQGFCTKESGKISGKIFIESRHNFSIKTIENYDDFITKPIDYRQEPNTDGVSTIKNITNETNYRVALALGFKLFEEKNFEESRNLLDIAEQFLPNSDELKNLNSIYSSSKDKLYFYRGSANFELGKLEKALSDFKIAIYEGRKKDSNMYYLLGSSHLNLKSISEVEEEKNIACAFGQFRKAYESDKKEEYKNKCDYALKRYMEIKKIRKADPINNENCQTTNRVPYDEQFCELPNPNK